MLILNEFIKKMLLNQLLQVAELNYSEALCRWSKKQLKYIYYLNSSCLQLKDDFEQLKHGNKILLRSSPHIKPCGTPEPSLFQHLIHNTSNLDQDVKDEARELTSIELDSICDLFNSYFGPILAREEIWKGRIFNKFYIVLEVNIPLSKSEEIASKFNNNLISEENLKGSYYLTHKRTKVLMRLSKLIKTGCLEKYKVTAKGDIVIKGKAEGDIVIKSKGLWLLGEGRGPLPVTELQKIVHAMIKQEEKKVQEK